MKVNVDNDNTLALLELVACSMQHKCRKSLSKYLFKDTVPIINSTIVLYRLVLESYNGNNNDIMLYL